MKCHFMVILLLGVTSILSEEICSVGDVKINGFMHANQFKLNASDRGIVVEEFETKNVINSYFEDSKYLEVKLEGNKMKIQLTDEFENYEKTESKLTIRVKWHIECEADGEKDSFSLDYEQYILEENKYDPEFFEKEYRYVFYGDLPKDIMLTNILPIKARDWDIPTEHIIFSMSKNEEFYLTWDDFENKIGTATLKTNKYIKAPLEGNYILEARDNFWGEYRSSSVPLTITVNTFYEKMEFEKDEYTAQWVGDQQLKFNDEIRLKNGLDFETEVNIRSDYVDYFAVSINMLTYTINVKLTKPLPLAISRRYNKIELFLDAHWRGANATTKVVINSEEPIKQLCYVYGLDLYANENKGDWIKDNHTGIIKVYDTLNVASVSCSGTGSKYISCKLESNSLVLSVTDEFRNYEDNEYSQYIYLNMSIECQNEDVFKTEYKQYIDDINNHDPLFDSEKYYFVFYNQLPREFVLTDVMPITVSDKDIDRDSFELEVESKAGDYLGASIQSYQQKQASCKFYAKQDIPPGFEEDFIVTVKDELYSNTYRSSKATISINVIKDQEQLKFKHSEINSVIKNNIIDSIELENGFDYDTKFNIRSEYEDYFKIVKNVLLNKIELHATKDLTAIKVDVVRIIIEAEWHGVTDSVTVYLYMDGVLPTTEMTTTPTTESWITEPSITESHYGMQGFKIWTNALNITQITVFTVAGITLCGMAFITWRYYY